jgi:hypothetical protein
MTLWILAALALLLLVVRQAVGLGVETARAAKLEAAGDAVARGAVIAVAQELLALHGKGAKDSSLKKMKEEKLKAGEELDFYLVKAGSWEVLKRGRGGQFPVYGGSWLDRDYAVCQVLPEDSKAPLALLEEKQLRRIPSIGASEAKSLGDFIRSNGVGLLSVKQLLALKAAQGDAFKGGASGPALDKIFTFHSDGKLYVNHLKLEDLEKASGVASAKKLDLLLKLEDLEKASGVASAKLSEKVKLLCGVYRIKACAVIGGRPSELEAVVALPAGDSFEILYMGGS